MFKVISSTSTQKTAPLSESSKLAWLNERDDAGHLIFQNPVTLGPIVASEKLVFHAACGKPFSMDDMLSSIRNDPRKILRARCFCCDQKIDFFNSNSRFGVLTHNQLFKGQSRDLQRQLANNSNWNILKTKSLNAEQYAQLIADRAVFAEAAGIALDQSEAQSGIPTVVVPCFTFMHKLEPARGVVSVNIPVDKFMDTSVEGSSFLPETPLLDLPYGQTVAFPSNEEFSRFAQRLSENESFWDCPAFAYVDPETKVWMIQIDQLPVLNRDGSIKLRLINTIDEEVVSGSRSFYLDNHYRFTDNNLEILIPPSQTPVIIPLKSQANPDTPVLLSDVLARLPEAYCVLSIESHPDRTFPEESQPVQKSRQNKEFVYLRICEKSQVKHQLRVPLLTTEFAYLNDREAEEPVVRGLKFRLKEQFDAIYDNAVATLRDTHRHLGRHLAVLSIIAVTYESSREKTDEPAQAQALIMRSVALTSLFLAYDVFLQYGYRIARHTVRHINRAIQELGQTPKLGLEKQLKYQHGGVSKVVLDQDGKPHLTLMSSEELN